MNARESRILSLEARVYRLPGLVSGLETRARNAEDTQRALWMWGSAPGGTLTVTVENFLLGNLAGATVEVADSSGNILTSAITNGSGVATFSGLPAGTYNIGAWLADYDPVDSGYSHNFVVTGGAQSLTLAMVTASNDFAFPPYINRTLIDPVYGTITLPFTAYTSSGSTNNAIWQVTQSVNYAACGGFGCSAVSGLSVTWTFTCHSTGGGAPSMVVTYKASGGSACPNNAGTTHNTTLTLHSGLDHNSPIKFDPTGPIWCSSATPLQVQ